MLHHDVDWDKNKCTQCSQSWGPNQIAKILQTEYVLYFVLSLGCLLFVPKGAIANKSVVAKNDYSRIYR